MFILYIIMTIGLFLGWIRLIPCIQKKRWLSGLFIFLAFILITWSSIEISRLANTASDGESTILLSFYCGYLFMFSVIFYNLAKFITAKYKK